MTCRTDFEIVKYTENNISKMMSDTEKKYPVDDENCFKNDLGSIDACDVENCHVCYNV